MKPLLGMFQLAFPCHRGQLSRPFTIKKGTYQVCLACAQEPEGSWAVTHSLRSNGADHCFVCRPPGAKRAEVCDRVAGPQP